MSSLVVGSILLRLNTITVCLKRNIFHNNFRGNIYEHILGYFQSRNPWQTFFGGDKSHLQKYKKLLLVESRFKIIRNLYSLQPTTLLEGVLKILHWKLWKISRKMFSVEFPFNKIARLHSAVCWIKNSTIGTFLELLRKDRIF